MTFIMKNLSSKSVESVILNQAFYLEVLDFVSKMATIGMLHFGIRVSEFILHNFLVFSFLIVSLILTLLALLSYGKLRVRLVPREQA